jgi:hypothetical protein
VAFAGVDVDFIPPAKANQTTSSNVFEVVEVDRKENEGENEDEDAGKKISSMADAVGRLETDKFLIKRTPKRYMSRLPIIRALVSHNTARSAARVRYLFGNPGSRVM